MDNGSCVLRVAARSIRYAKAYTSAIQGGERGRDAARGEARRVLRRVGRGVGCPVPGDGLVGMLTLGKEPVGLRGVVGAACSSDVYVDAHGFVCSE